MRLQIKLKNPVAISMNNMQIKQLLEKNKEHTDTNLKDLHLSIDQNHKNNQPIKINNILGHIPIVPGIPKPPTKLQVKILITK